MTTFTYVSNNELSTMVDYNGTTTFSYDIWGRMITKAFGGNSAVYGYGQGSKMIKVSSMLPGEGTVDYKYGGDGKRRERDDGTNLTWYNWDVGYNVINEEDEWEFWGHNT